MQTETQTDARTDRRARTSWGAWGAHDVDTEHPPRPSPWTNQGKASNFCHSDSTTVFARSPPSPQPVVVGPYMPNFELFYYLITSYCLLFIVYYSLPPPPYAACVMPLRAHPLADVCAAAPGGWAHEAKQINHCTSVRAPVASAPMGPAPRPRAHRASLGTG